MLRASPNQVVAGTQGPANWAWPPAGCPRPPRRPAPSGARAGEGGGLAGQRRRVGPRATAPSLRGDALQPERLGAGVRAGGAGGMLPFGRQPPARGSEHPPVTTQPPFYLLGNCG